MDNEMIERCVKAGVSAAGFGKYDTKKIVLAVIKAMREPTQKMLRADNVHTNCFTCGGHREGWYAMIDAITND